MALPIRTLYRNCNFARNLIKPVNLGFEIRNPTRILASGICYQNGFSKPLHEKPKVLLPQPHRLCSTENTNPEKPKSKGLVQRFKEMYRDYWYVLLPVHGATSVIWYGSFYYAVRSGVDVIAILEYVGMSETLISPLRDSTAGYFAFAFALYKLASPLRYAVTVGLTTFAIKRLTLLGWIKPVPSRDRIKEMLQERKDNLQDRFIESKQHYQTQMKERSSKMMDEMRRYKSEVRNMKNKVKKM